MFSQTRDTDVRRGSPFELGADRQTLITDLNYDGMPITADHIYRQISQAIGASNEN